MEARRSEVCRSIMPSWTIVACHWHPLLEEHIPDRMGDFLRGIPLTMAHREVWSPEPLVLDQRGMHEGKEICSSPFTSTKPHALL